jgi:hypothetical protein
MTTMIALFLAGATLSAADAGAAATTASAPATPPPSTAAAPSQGKPDATTFDPLDLLVGKKTGLEIWGRDGKRKRIVSKGEARYPRWLNPETVVVLRTGGRPIGEGTAVVETVSLNDGSRHRVARIPKFKCAGAAANDTVLELDLQDESDFSVDEQGELICLDLLDRNINMASLGVKVVLSAKSGKIRRWLDLGKEECAAPAGMAKGEPATCEGRGPRPTIPEAEESPRPTLSASLKASSHGVVINGEPGGPYKVEDYTEESASPSKRWVVLGGEAEDGDYIHRKLVLFDRQTGRIFPILEKGRKWPAPLEISGAGKRRRIKTPIKDGYPVVGETPVFWLGPANREILVIENSIVVPGQFVFSLDGDMVR